VEATVADLKSKGVTILMEPKKADWGTAAMFQDVDGNRFLISSK
jgi:predicted enzyme related to lactoylglutathione lyase